MKSKKLMAVALTATMVVGSSVTAFAEDTNSATGTGEAFNHVDKNILAVTLPTTSDVANVFNYYVDPERAIQDAGTLADGSTAVTPNNDGVYFAHPGSAEVPATNATVTAFSIGGKTKATDTDSDGTPDITVTIPTTYTETTLTYDAANSYWVDGSNSEVSGVSFVDSDTTNPVTTANAGDTITVSPYVAGTPAGAASYSATSEEVEFEGKNSVDVDISVAATVTASQGGKDIALVEDQDALDDATTPALLMTLHVGSKSAAITSDGATVKETIVGKPNNFAVTTANNKFVYGIRTNTDVANGGTALDAWGSANVKLAGKTNNKTIEEGMTAPTIDLTWSVTKHTTSALSATTISSTSNTLTVTSGVNVTGVTLVKTTGATAACVSGTNYTFSNGTLSVQAGLLSNNRGGKLRIALSNGNTEEVTIQ